MHKSLTISLIAILAVLGGCIRTGSMIPPQEASTILPVTPAIAYQRATKAMTLMPRGVVVSQDATTHALTGEVRGKVRLVVLVEPQGAGALVTVHGSVMPQKTAVGTFDEVDQYVALLKEVQ